MKTDAATAGNIRVTFGLSDDQSTNGVLLSNSQGESKYINGAGQLVSAADMGDNRPNNGVITVTVTKVEEKTSSQPEAWTEITNTAASMKRFQGNYHVVLEGVGATRLHAYSVSTTYHETNKDVFEATEEVDVYFKITSEGAIAYYGEDSTFTAIAGMQARYSVADNGEDTEENAHGNADKVEVKSLAVAD